MLDFCCVSEGPSEDRDEDKGSGVIPLSHLALQMELQPLGREELEQQQNGLLLWTFKFRDTKSVALGPGQQHPGGGEKAIVVFPGTAMWQFQGWSPPQVDIGISCWALLALHVAPPAVDNVYGTC